MKVTVSGELSFPYKCDTSLARLVCNKFIKFAEN